MSDSERARLHQILSNDAKDPNLGAFDRAALTAIFDERRLYWRPLPGPQTTAFYTRAHELLYGGAAGGGKSDLLLGRPVTAHIKSVIFRREYGMLKDLVERSKALLGDHGSFNHNEYMWRFERHDGRLATLEFGGVQHEKDREKWKGRPHDFKGFDELADFTYALYRFLIAWNRSTNPNQFCQALSASNPPSNEIGDWMIDHWAPWVNPNYPDPAAPGELRWFVTINDKSVECDSPEPFEHEGELLIPRSRTFVPALLDDNPYLARTNYRAVLLSLPEPLRSMYLKGDFLAGRKDSLWQVIPSDWVERAMQRWEQQPGRPLIEEHSTSGMLHPLDQLGVDVAMGGDANTVLARRFVRWFAEPDVHPGRETSTPYDTFQLIKHALATGGGGYAVIDVNGPGSSVYRLCREARLDVRAFVGSAHTPLVDRSGRLHFRNVRSAAYWQLREALDPSQPREKQLALPRSRKLKTQLCAVRWKAAMGGVIALEEKIDVMDRLGESPDLADACVMAHWRDPIWSWEEARGTEGKVQTVANFREKRDAKIKERQRKRLFDQDGPQ